MGRITLPQKISKWSIVKLFTLTVLVVSGYYFYPTLIKDQSSKNNESVDNWDQVLSSTSNNPKILYKVEDYLLDNTKRPECYTVQDKMDFTCIGPSNKLANRNINSIFDIIYDQSLVYLSSGGNNTNFAYNPVVANQTYVIPNQVKYYGNPVLDVVEGIPILAYYGGFHEIVLDSGRQKVLTFERTFSTDSDQYTAGCVSSWFPSSMVKKNNTFLFGSGGLESLFNDRCYRRADSGDGSWGGPTYNGYNCRDYALKVGIPLYPNCRVSARESCWDRSSQCKGLAGNASQYQNYPLLTRMVVSRSSARDVWGGLLYVSAVSNLQGPNSGGATARDAQTFCYGKTKNNCTEIKAFIQYGKSPSPVYNMRMTENSASIGQNQLEDEFKLWYPLDHVNRPEYNPQKNFTKRVFYGYTPDLSLQVDSNYGGSWNYGGYDSPVSAYYLRERIDVFYKFPYNFADSRRNYQTYNKYIRNYTNDGRIKPIYFPPGTTGNRPIFETNPTTGNRAGLYANWVLSDASGKGYFVSDKYYFIAHYFANEGVIRVARYYVTGHSNKNPTLERSLELRGVYLPYFRNISFAINSADDLDIMFAPNYAESETANPGVNSRIFRAKNFNTFSGNQADFSLYELTESNGGYRFVNFTDRNNTPLTFRYYNNEDADTSNDYAVFVSRNYVFTSKVPTVQNCTLVGGGLSITNTSPHSLNFGIPIVTTNVFGPNSYNLNFAFNNPINLSCPSSIVNLPEGTIMNLTLYDGITSAPLANTLSARLLPDRKSFSFVHVEPDYYRFKKYYYTVSFVYNGQTYRYPSTGVDVNRYFTLEGYLFLTIYKDGNPPTPLPDSKLVITKTFRNSQRQYSFSYPVGSNYQVLTSLVHPEKRNYQNFFWDHNMVKIGSTLTDEVKYKLCFTNTPDTKVTGVSFGQWSNSISTTTLSNYFINDYITAVINNGCLDLNYKSNIGSYYSFFPQYLNIYLTTTTLPDISTKVNFRVNGNTMIKNTTDVKNYSTPGIDKKYQGSYIASSIIGDKGYQLSNFNKNQYFKIPFYSNLTSALNFSGTQDLGFFNKPSNTNVGFVLLTDNNPIGPSNNFNKIDVFKVNKEDPSIIYVAKNKTLYFDLTNTNITTSLTNKYFVSTDSSNTQERIIFNIDCNNPNYSLICNQNYEYHLKGGIYGDFRINGKLNFRIQDKVIITLHQNPDILILLQKDLRSKKIFNVTRSKTIFKYLND